MDMYDGFWFPEPAAQLPSFPATTSTTPATTPCLSSPSSGYSSADEGRATPVGPWPGAAGLESSSGWASPSHCLLSSDPYLGELVGRPAAAAADAEYDGSAAVSSWSGSNVGLDDLMDTLWDSLSAGVDSTQRPGDWSELMADGNLTKQYPITTTTTTTISYGFSDSNSSYNTVYGMAGGAIGENSLVDLVDDGLRTSASGAVFVGQPLTVATDQLQGRRPFDTGLQQHMAGLMSDMATGDADDYLLQYCTALRPSTTAAAAPGSPRPGGRRLLAAVRSPPNSMLHAAASASSRVRGAVLAKSCGDSLLQRAATGFSAQPAAPGRSPAPSVAATSRTRPPAPQQSAARVAGLRPSISSARLSDVRGSTGGGSIGRVASYPALDDHRYTLKAPPPPNPHPPPSKIQKTGSRSSGMRHSASSGRLVGVTSILEAFLRSTRPMDPNKGSNAVLAAAGLAHLPLTGSGAASTATVTADRRPDDEASGTLLKKLLTGEMDQDAAVQRSCRPLDGTLPAAAEAMGTAGDGQALSDESGRLSVDCMLAEEFGLDADFCLDDPQSMNINLLDDVADDGLWMTTDGDNFFDDKLMSSELDEILREQNRQDDLWMQHYVSELF